MIAWIKGNILKKSQNSVFILNQNLAYEILVSQEDIQRYNQEQEVSFFVFSWWKDKWFEFYGFKTLKQRELFQLLLSVSGLGPKSAYKIIESYSFEQIVQTIANKEIFLFEKITGIGKKTAAKIIIELEKKVTKFRKDVIIESNDFIKNTFSALQHMGFDNSSILQVIQKVLLLKTKEQNFEFFLKQCLKRLKK